MTYKYVIDDQEGASSSACLFGFKVNDATPLADHKSYLEKEIRARLKQIPQGMTGCVRIAGLCSYTGSQAYNEALGLRRANAIYDHCDKIGLTSMPNTQWYPLETHGFADAARVEPNPPRSRYVREQQGEIFRAVDFDIITRAGKPPAKPRPLVLHYFQMRTIYSVSISPPIPIFPGVSVGGDYMMFEIKDVHEQTCAVYRYEGGLFSVGIPLDKLEGAVKMGRLTKIVLQIPGVASGAFAGPWNDFTHVRGPTVYKPVDKWWGPATYFSVGAFNMQGLPGWINFGGFDTKPPFRHSARIDPYDGGNTVGFPAINTGEGYLTLASAPQKCKG